MVDRTYSRAQRRVIPGASILLFIMTAVAPAHACTLCHSDTAALVRAGLFDQNFDFNLLVTMLPFAVFAAIGLLVHGPRASHHPLDKETRR